MELQELLWGLLSLRALFAFFSYTFRCSSSIDQTKQKEEDEEDGEEEEEDEVDNKADDELRTAMRKNEHPRQYQVEIYQLALENNIIAYLDTGYWSIDRSHIDIKLSRQHQTYELIIREWKDFHSIDVDQGDVREAARGEHLSPTR